jgi:SAM-dependent methyltransferase
MVVNEDSTIRFGRRVGDYVRYRPGYPAALIELLARESGLGPGSVVADIGSGTGLLSRAFDEAGYKVIGVEPNREMREASDFPGVDGRAEATNLADRSVDLIVAGQAFHWFDPEPTRREWRRILRPQGTIGLIWNEGLHEGAFMRAVGEVIDSFGEERDKGGVIREAGRNRIAGFFAPAAVRTAEFPNQQQFDFEGLRGRVFSSSYLPAEGEPGAEALTRELERIFDRHQSAGRVTFLYRTKVYWAKPA